MRDLLLMVTVALAFPLVGGCSGSSDAEHPAAVQQEITSFQHLATDVGSAATSFEHAMMSPDMRTADQCTQLQSAYDAEVRPMLSQMAEWSPDLDEFMGYHGGADVADVTCLSSLMLNALDEHRSVACLADDMMTNQLEAQGHVTRMHAYTDWAVSRCGELLSDSGQWTWGNTMNGCAQWQMMCGYDGQDGHMMMGMHQTDETCPTFWQAHGEGELRSSVLFP